VLELVRAGHGVERWAPTGDLAPAVLLGNEVLLGFRRNETELARRAAFGLGAMTDRGSLELLVSMPVDAAVPGVMFGGGDRAAMRRQPEGVFGREGEYVRRLLQPGVTLLSVGVEASNWKQGFERVAPFASYCSRYVVVRPRRRADLEFAAFEARFYGVGLAVVNGSELEWLVAPALFVVERFTAASWLMAERVVESLQVLGE